MAKPRKPKAPPALPPPERRVTLCVIGAPHGVRGECRVKAFTADPMAIADYGPLFAADGRVFEINDGRFLKDDLLVVKFEGITDRDAVARLTGTELFVDRHMLPETEEEDEFYHADLIGIAVRDLEGAEIGTIAAVHDFGAGDILEIRPAQGGPTWLLPFTKTALPRLDVAMRVATADPAFLAKPESAREKPPEAGGDEE
ncbi:MAG: ribosome maturation factor RimM [Proteobacteria bacterium]|nr:ribosome maturation factor RimM [Pseudomonadota bacterium]